jgi:hypothetical protein
MNTDKENLGLINKMSVYPSLKFIRVYNVPFGDLW